MPSAPLRLCAYPYCSAIVQRGRCALHAVVKEHARGNYDVRRWYRTARWKGIRQIVLGRDPLCVLCLLSGSATPATEVDHRERHRGDYERFWDIANMQGLCAPCHGRKTAAGE